jgi:L-threonylcarbamoyladenylate synthase
MHRAQTPRGHPAHWQRITPADIVTPAASGRLQDALAKVGRPGGHIAVLAHSITQPPDFEGTWFDAPLDSAGYAHQLYANLRALDARQADEIWIETPPDGPDWTAINDRLRRATHRD